MKKHYPKAFSLVEISVVVLIVGILIAGITTGSKMVNKSKLANAQALTTSSKIEQIPDMILWYEATLPRSVSGSSNTQQPEDGDSVSGWKDLNPSNTVYNASQTTSANQPLYKTSGINGIPALKFDGSNDYFQITNILGNNYTFFIVLRTSSAGAGNSGSYTYAASSILWADSSGANDSDTIPLAIGGGYPKIGVSADVVLTSSIAVNDDAPHIITMKRTRALGNISMYVDGASAASSTGGNTNIVNTIANLSFGGNTVDGRYYTGYIGEFIIFERPLNQKERKIVENYLGKKWGVVVS